MKSKRMKIALISSEVAPFSAGGEMGHVCGSLASAMASRGHDVVVVMPLYASVARDRLGLSRVAGIGGIAGLGGAEVWEGRLAAPGPSGRVVRVFLLGNAFFNRVGIYHENGRSYPDNDERFGFFSRSALALLRSISFSPDVIHVHDWPTALVPVYLKVLHRDDDFFAHTGTVLTVHNVSYQGLFSSDRLRAVALPPELFHPGALEYYGQINFLKGGIVFSEIVTTPSPSYTRQICGREMGCGMDGILTAKKDCLVGILNGIDYDEWNPSREGTMVPPYSADDMEGKREAKKAMTEAMGLHIDAKALDVVPVMSAVTPIDLQKGCDILLRALFRIMPKMDVRVAVLGTGSRDLEGALVNLSRQFPGKASVVLKNDPDLAKLVLAGSDFVLIPSKYEPCGMVQMTSMAYGTVPVARLTGGLADTVREFDLRTGNGTGFGFTGFTAEALCAAVDKAMHVFRNGQQFRALRQNIMKERWTWGRAAQGYERAYARAAEIRGKGGT